MEILVSIFPGKYSKVEEFLLQAGYTLSLIHISDHDAFNSQHRPENLVSGSARKHGADAVMQPAADGTSIGKRSRHIHINTSRIHHLHIIIGRPVILRHNTFTIDVYKRQVHGAPFRAVGMVLEK